MAGEIAGYKGDVYFSNGYNANPHSWSLDAEADMLEVTGFESGNHREYIAGLQQWSGSVTYYLSRDEEPPKPGDTEADLRLYVDENRYWGGYVLVTNVSVTTDLEEAEELTVEFQGVGGWASSEYDVDGQNETVVTGAYDETQYATQVSAYVTNGSTVPADMGMVTNEVTKEVTL